MIIGITGTNGSGKGAVVDYLVSKKGFKHYSARDFIVAEIERRGLPVNRTAMQDVGNELRKIHGPAYIIEELYKKAEAGGGNAVIESIREVAGAQFLKDQGAVLLAIDADRRLRYERATGRGSATDQVTFEEFCMQEERELDSPEAWSMSIIGVIQLADYRISNDGTLAELHESIEDFLGKIS